MYSVWNEVNELAKQMYEALQSNDVNKAEEIKTEISEKLMPEIEKMARRYSRSRRNEHEDLVSEGFMGLLHAFDRYNPEKGRFSDFARSTIDGYMKKYLERGIQLIGVPATMSKEDRAIKKKIDKLRRKLGREPTLGEMKEAGIHVEDIIKQMWISMAGSPASMDIPIAGEDDEMSLYDIISDYDEEKENLRRDLQWIEKNMLTTTERKIWNLYKEGYSQSEIAAKLGISQPQVSRVIRRVTDKFKRLMKVESK